MIAASVYGGGVMGGKATDVRASLVCSLRTIARVVGVRFPRIFKESVARGIHARAAHGSGMLRVPDTVNRIFILSKGSNSADAVGEVLVKLLDDIFLRVVSGNGIGAI